MRCVTPSSVHATALPFSRETALFSVSSAWSRCPSLRCMMARLTSGAANCGYCKAICLKLSSASVALPARMYFTARSKSARASGGTSGCTAPAAAPAVAAAVPAAPAEPGAAAPVAGAPCPAGFDAVLAAGAAVGRTSCELHAASESASAPASARVTVTARTLFQADDDIVRHLRLRVARGLEFRERLVTLAHPLVVDAVLDARRVDLMHLDRLFLEREHLLLEERVVR